jgi:hypothetical protein
MTIKQVVLSVLTFLVLIVIGSSLVSSWNEPQVTGQLQLYQSDLLLQATEWQGEGLAAPDAQQVRSVLLGKDPLATVVEQYNQTRQEAEQSLALTQTALAQSETQQRVADPGKVLTLKQTLDQQQALITRLDVRLGILAAQQADPDKAFALWQQVAQQPGGTASLTATAEALSALWQDQADPAVETLLQQNLQGWFRYRALEKLYMIEDQPQALRQLEQQEQALAQTTLMKLVVIGIFPALGSVIGAGLLIFLAAQWWLKRGDSILAIYANKGWTVPWDGEVIWQVLVVGLFLCGANPDSSAVRLFWAQFWDQ